MSQERSDPAAGAGEQPEMVALREADADPDPLAQFARWFEEAAVAGHAHPETMALATASPDGVPSVRMVLMKGYDADGFVFFTHYDSRKGGELAANPRAALLFYWEALGRQVRIEGEARPASPEQTERYVKSRPRGSQLSALASPQSQVVAGREALEEWVAELAARYGKRELPVPERWGGFVIAPQSFEFWQHRDDRLHDRLRYTPAGAGRWRIERLAP